MATSSDTPFAGMDFGQYSQWQAIRDPSGQAYYVLPGNPGYVYDPFSSAAAGRPVIYRNPMAAVADRDKAISAEERAKKKAEDAASPINQAIPSVLGAAGTIGGLYLANQLFAPVAKEAGKEVVKEVATQTLGETAADAAMGGGSAMGESMGGGADVASSGTNVLTAPLETLGGYTPADAMGVVQAAYGGYEAAKGMDQGGKGVRSGLTNLGAGIGTILMPGLGTAGGALIGNTLGYGLQGDGWKNKLATFAISPPLGVAQALGFNPIRKTVAQRMQNRTEDLQDLAPDDQAWQQYVSGMRNQRSANPDLPFAGKYETWEDYVKGGLNASDLSGVYGNMKTFGADWGKFTQAQREAITQAGIDAGLYDASTGDVMVTDPEKLKELATLIIGGPTKQIETEVKKEDEKELSAAEMFQKAYMGR